MRRGKGVAWAASIGLMPGSPASASLIVTTPRSRERPIKARCVYPVVSGGAGPFTRQVCRRGGSQTRPFTPSSAPFARALPPEYGRRLRSHGCRDCHGSQPGLTGRTGVSLPGGSRRRHAPIRVAGRLTRWMRRLPVRHVRSRRIASDVHRPIEVSRIRSTGLLRST